MTQDESNPYNTYKISTCRLRPISNPGDNAIQAALHPEGGNWLYFCVNLDTGETKFAATADEHDQNVAELRKWQAETSSHLVGSSPRGAVRKKRTEGHCGM